jgi:hypothetical protein
MPAFIEQFAAGVQNERERLAFAFGPSAADRQEEALRTAIRAAWRPLSASSTAPLRPAFATDGSQAIRHFNNGWTMVVCHALCVGPGYESPSVDVRFVRSGVPDSILTRYAGLLMRLLEVRAALDNVDRAAGGVMCLDGSLHAMLPHLIYPVAVDEASDLPLLLLESYLDLIDACSANDVLLVSLSKTSTGSFLGEALLRLDDPHGLPGNVDLFNDPLPPMPTDMEVLYRWTDGAGYSRPLVLGSQGFGHRRGQLLSAPEQLIGAFGSGGRSYGDRLALLNRLASAPATVSAYVRMRPEEDPLRIDLPAPSVGIDDRIRDTYLRWADSADLAEVRAHLSGAYGGRSVYHAALYVADQLVRLNNATVDTAYLSIIRAQFGAYVQYDRSRRRFI